MTRPAIDDDWQKLGQLRPRLRSHTAWQRMPFRGIDWYLLHDRASGRHYHFSQSAYRLLRLLDGETSLEQALAQLAAPAQPDRAMRREALNLLLRLRSADLLWQAEGSDSERLYRQWRQQSGKGRLAQLTRPLAVRLPLFDPDRLLQRTLPLVRPLFHWSALLLWLAVVTLAGVLALQQGEALLLHGESRLLDPANLLLLWFSYPLVKGLHELGHAYAIRHWGGKVHELGIMLLVFVPVPYVEASSATAFMPFSQKSIAGGLSSLIQAQLGQSNPRL